MNSLHTASDVAKWLLQRNNVEVETSDAEYLSNLKIQKLLYYAQGVCLSMYDRALFADDLVAWEHGPVVIKVYHEYSSHGARGIEYTPDKAFAETYTDEEKDVLETVYNYFGQFSAWKLRNMTHEEKPWRVTPRNGVIDLGVMKDFFKAEYSINE